MKEFPKLMIDDSEKDGHAEPIMDYVISWCLRCSPEEYYLIKPLLQKECKYLVCNLLERNFEDVVILNVRTYKQDLDIDVWAEIELENKGKLEFHAILIENKYYSKLRKTTDIDGIKRNQLLVYKKKFLNYYKAKENNYILHYHLITCVDRNDPNFKIYDEALEYGYKIWSFSEVLRNNIQYTESDIFNEFWLRW